jgi:tetratricopeptide (TPR) repeat protein
MPRYAPTNSTATTNRDAELMVAIAHHQSGRLDEAEQIYQRLHTADATDAEVIYLLGVLCFDLGLSEACCRFLEQALAITPQFPEARRQLAVARNARGLEQLQAQEYEAAERSLRRVLELDPDLNQARNNLGLALYHRGRLIDARRCFEEALTRNPGYTAARLNLANTLRIQGEHGAARGELETLLADNPDSIEALNNLGAVAQDMGDTGLALRCLEHAAALTPHAPATPHTPQVRWNLALTQLLLGDFTNGWRNFESRWEGCAHLRGGYTLPLERAWQGEPVSGKWVLLWAEQGFGDTVQFIRFAQDVAAKGALVGVLVPPELERLMQGVPGILWVTAMGRPLPRYDVHCPLMSLPYRLGVTPDATALHGTAAYLAAPPAETQQWHRRLSAFPGLKVGLAWAGRPRKQSAELDAIDARRNVPLHSLAPLLAVHGCSFFSLQKGLESADIAASGLPIRDFSTEWRDFADTAAFIAGLDLVISVDTAVAHVAAALGKPVWLLNRYDSCWRWLLGRSDSPWYSTLRLFRQSRAGDWTPVIAAAAAELHACAESHAAAASHADAERHRSAAQATAI